MSLSITRLALVYLFTVNARGRVPIKIEHASTSICIHDRDEPDSRFETGRKRILAHDGSDDIHIVLFR